MKKIKILFLIAFTFIGQLIYSQQRIDVFRNKLQFDNVPLFNSTLSTNNNLRVLNVDKFGNVVYTTSNQNSNIQSITGNIVNNTDPNNLIINSPNLEQVTAGIDSNHQTTKPLISTETGQFGVEIFPDTKGIRIITNNNNAGVSLKSDLITDEVDFQFPPISGIGVVSSQLSNYIPFNIDIELNDYSISSNLGFKNSWINGNYILGGYYQNNSNIKELYFETRGYEGVYEGQTVIFSINPENGVTSYYNSLLTNNSASFRVFEDGIKANTIGGLFTYNNKEVLTIETGTVKGVNNSTTIVLSSTTLNSIYPDATTGFEVYCTSIISGKMVYKKIPNGWIGYACITP